MIEIKCEDYCVLGRHDDGSEISIKADDVKNYYGRANARDITYIKDDKIKMSFKESLSSLYKTHSELPKYMAHGCGRSSYTDDFLLTILYSNTDMARRLNKDLLSLGSVEGDGSVSALVLQLTSKRKVPFSKSQLRELLAWHCKYTFIDIRAVVETEHVSVEAVDFFLKPDDYKITTTPKDDRSNIQVTVNITGSMNYPLKYTIPINSVIGVSTPTTLADRIIVNSDILDDIKDVLKADKRPTKPVAVSLQGIKWEYFEDILSHFINKAMDKEDEECFKESGRKFYNATSNLSTVDIFKCDKNEDDEDVESDGVAKDDKGDGKKLYKYGVEEIVIKDEPYYFHTLIPVEIDENNLGKLRDKTLKSARKLCDDAYKVWTKSCVNNNPIRDEILKSTKVESCSKSVVNESNPIAMAVNAWPVDEKVTVVTNKNGRISYTIGSHTEDELDYEPSPKVNETGKNIGKELWRTIESRFKTPEPEHREFILLDMCHLCSDEQMEIVKKWKQYLNNSITD